MRELTDLPLPDRIEHWRSMLEGQPLRSAGAQAAEDMDRFLEGEYVEEKIRGQLRRHSFWESVTNTAVGFLLSFIVWIPVTTYVLHKPWHPVDGTAVVLIFTVISLVRGYFLRRIFNKWT